MNAAQISNTRRPERQYVGHRFLLTRSARRHTPDYEDDDDASTLPSVDTSFVQGLINSTDKKFVDSLVGPTKTSEVDRVLEGPTKAQKRWWLPKKCGHVILGMALMYILLTFWERQRTKLWWDSYRSELDTSMYTRTMEQAKVPGTMNGPSYWRGQYDDALKDPTKLYGSLASTGSGLRSSSNSHAVSREQASNEQARSSMYLSKPIKSSPGRPAETASVSATPRSDYAASLTKLGQDVFIKEKPQHDSLWHQANALAQVRTGESSVRQSNPLEQTSSQQRRQSLPESVRRQDEPRLLPPPSLSFHGQSRQSMMSQAGKPKFPDAWSANGLTQNGGSSSIQATDARESMTEPGRTKIGYMIDPDTPVVPNGRGELVSAIGGRRL